MRLACVPLPAPGGPSNTTGPMFCEVSIRTDFSTLPASRRTRPAPYPPADRAVPATSNFSLCPTAAAADTAAAWGKSVVMAHDELRFNLRHRIHRHTDNDQ